MAVQSFAESLTRESKEVRTNLVTGTNMNWDVITKTILDEDTGI